MMRVKLRGRTYSRCDSWHCDHVLADRVEVGYK